MLYSSTDSTRNYELSELRKTISSAETIYLKNMMEFIEWPDSWNAFIDTYGMDHSDPMMRSAIQSFENTVCSIIKKSGKYTFKGRAKMCAKAILKIDIRSFNDNAEMIEFFNRILSHKYLNAMQKTQFIAILKDQLSDSQRSAAIIKAGSAELNSLIDIASILNESPELAL